MQINPAKIRYLQLVERRSGWHSETVEQIGEPIQSVKKRFALIPAFERLRLADQDD
jgi:hypothetical protein